MKLLAFSIAFGLLLFPQSGAQKTDREDDDLRGGVRSILTESATLENRKGEWVEGHRFTSSVTRYDEPGNRLETVHYTKDFISSRVIYHRESQDTYRRESYSWLRRDSSGAHAMVSTCTIKRDGEGNLIERACDPGDDVRTRTLYRYDREKRTREATEYRDDVVRSRCTEQFDENGLMISRDCPPLSKDDGVRRIFEYQVDSNGNWVKRVGSTWDRRAGGRF